MVDIAAAESTKPHLRLTFPPLPAPLHDYLANICEEGVANPVIIQRHYIDQGHRLPRDTRALQPWILVLKNLP